MGRDRSHLENTIFTEFVHFGTGVKEINTPFCIGDGKEKNMPFYKAVTKHLLRTFDYWAKPYEGPISFLARVILYTQWCNRYTWSP